MEVKEILKTRREILGMTCEDVGEKVGVSASTISRWERGDIANMKSDKIAKLSEVLNLSPAVIMGWEKPFEESCYSDPEIETIAREIYSRPELRVLFNALENISKDDIYFITEMVHKMQK